MQYLVYRTYDSRWNKFSKWILYLFRVLCGIDKKKFSTQKLNNNTIKISSVTKKKKIKLKYETLKIKPINKVIFVQPLFYGNRSGFDPVMPDIVAMDWQVRLFRKLNQMNYQITIKPHPLSKVQIPSNILGKFNIQMESDIFEKVYSSHELIIFDFPLTSTFHYALKSEIPIIYINFSDAKYPTELKKYLEKRVQIIKGWYDVRNKAIADLFNIQYQTTLLIFKNNKEVYRSVGETTKDLIYEAIKSSI